MGDTTTLLTISIPTYNRPEQLKRTLTYLLPQMTSECFLRIIDNYSTIAVKDYTESIIKQYPGIKYEIVRNKINVGADNNIMRCFEYCETDWLWTLGDDDILTDNAIEIILTDIDKYKEAVNINYYSPSPNHPERSKEVFAFGKVGNIESMDSFGAAIFISSNVYNFKIISAKHDLSQSYHYTYSCASQWFILYCSLGDKGLSIYSSKVICTNGDIIDNYAIHSMYSLKVASGFASFIELLTTKELKKILISKLKTSTAAWITFDSIVKALVVEYKRDNSLNILLPLQQIYSRFYKYFGIKVRLKFWFIYSLLLISPKFTYQIIRYLYLKKRNIDLNIFIP